MSGILLCLSVVGCKEAEVVFKEKTNPVDKYINFVEIAYNFESGYRESVVYDKNTIYKDDRQNTEVLYDKNTKVMYYIQSSGYTLGITPIYNSDGTVKLYDGDKQPD